MQLLNEDQGHEGGDKRTDRVSAGESLLCKLDLQLRFQHLVHSVFSTLENESSSPLSTE
jgi:hypothetical protein